MYGVALEGGGMKGAYHLGAVKAILESGYEIGGYVGTSIGSFNAAVLAQGDFKKLYNRWYNGSATLGLELKENELIKFVCKKWDMSGIKYWAKFFSESIANRGIDTTKLKALYSEYIDEEKLRNSTYDYGMVTVSLTDRKPLYMFKEDIPKGQIANYVLASSYLPVFKQDKILKDDKLYIDGGFYDNCPIILLKNKGYRDIFEIRTKAIGVSRKIDRKKLNIITILPSKDLGGILFSDNSIVRNNMLMGYYDALRVIKGYIGKKFYVIPTENERIFNALLKLEDNQILKIVDGLKIARIENMEPKKILFEKIIPYIQNKLKGMDTNSYQKNDYFND